MSVESNVSNASLGVSTIVLSLMLNDVFNSIGYDVKVSNSLKRLCISLS